MNGWRVAHDWLLRSRVDARKQASRFQNHRKLLSSKLMQIVYPEIAIANIREYELNRTVAALRRGFSSSISRGSIWTPMESTMSISHEEYLVNREVYQILMIFLFRIYKFILEPSTHPDSQSISAFCTRSQQSCIGVRISRVPNNLSRYSSSAQKVTCYFPCYL